MTCSGLNQVCWSAHGPRVSSSVRLEMVKHVTLAIGLMLGSTVLGAANKEQGRLENCGIVMQEILDVPDNIPQELLEKAECVIVIPSMTKVAIGIGGSYGRGAMVCRSGQAFDGPWGAPAMYALDGGSVGLQLGAESTDVVMLVMNRRGVDALLSSKVKLGGNASAAAGPKGRNLEASTDVTMRAEILSYSRARGLFAGVSLEGSSLRPDNDANKDVYGRKLTARSIVTGAAIAAPESGRHLIAVLEKGAPRNQSKKTTGQ
jgi:lipid-binding SYLF domain-containing protein